MMQVLIPALRNRNISVTKDEVVVRVSARCSVFELHI
jgi:hypothetical protein